MIQDAHDKTLITMRVADASVVPVGSRQGNCDCCGWAVWVSPASERALGAGAEVLCLQCYGKREPFIGPQKVSPPTPEQIGEILDYFRPDRPEQGHGPKPPRLGDLK